MGFVDTKLKGRFYWEEFLPFGKIDRGNNLTLSLPGAFLHIEHHKFRSTTTKILQTVL